LIWFWAGLVVQDVDKDSSGFEDILKAGFSSGLCFETEEDQIETMADEPTFIGHEKCRDMQVCGTGLRRMSKRGPPSKVKAKRASNG